MWQRSVHDDAAFRRLLLWTPAVFAGLILAGALLIQIPALRKAGPGLPPLSSLFTMTSAVCGVGLTVERIGDRFTPLGQAVIGISIELGALWTMLVGSAVVYRLRVRWTPGPDRPPEAALAEPTLEELANRIVTAALVVQLVAAALLAPMWRPADPLAPDLAWGDHLQLSMFHSVSAFANGGLSLQGDGLRAYQYGEHALGLHLVILPLMFLGGLGYPLWAELWARRLSPYGRMVLATTLLVYALSVPALWGTRLAPYTYAAFQLGGEGRRPELRELDLGTHGAILADASFMATSARGGGFRMRSENPPYLSSQALPRDEDLPGESVVYLALMAIGGAPGGTAGGMTVLAVALAAAGAAGALRGRPGRSPGGNPIGPVPARLALLVATGFAALVLAAVFLLAQYETVPIFTLLFEAVSAAGGCGLSMGAGDNLTSFGKETIIAVMFLGRVGLLMLMGLAVAGALPAPPPGPSPASPPARPGPASRKP